MGHAETAALIAERLTRETAPLHLEVTDDSASHAGHEGAKSGGGHFEVTLVSSLFVGTDRMTRHRLVYRLLSDQMQRTIHALSLALYTPEEWNERIATR